VSTLGLSFDFFLAAGIGAIGLAVLLSLSLGRRPSDVLAGSTPTGAIPVAC